MSTVSGVGARIQRLVGFIFNELDHDDNSLDSPLIAAHYADALIFSLLEGVPHSCTALLPSRLRAAAPRHVHLVAEYLLGRNAMDGAGGAWPIRVGLAAWSYREP